VRLCRAPGRPCLFFMNAGNEEVVERFNAIFAPTAMPARPWWRTFPDHGYDVLRGLLKPRCWIRRRIG